LESIFLVSHTSKDGVISSLGWEACGKVVRKEAWDYGELVVSVLLTISISIDAEPSDGKMYNSIHDELNKLSSRPFSLSASPLSA